MKGYATQSIGCGARDAPHEDDRYCSAGLPRGRRLASFHEALFATLNTLDEYRFEVIYVLDRSPDKSLLVLRKLAENHRTSLSCTCHAASATKCRWSPESIIAEAKPLS